MNIFVGGWIGKPKGKWEEKHLLLSLGSPKPSALFERWEKTFAHIEYI